MDKKKIKVCEFAYKRAEIIGMTGDVTFCCPTFTDYYNLGNLHEQTFEEIWNGEKAQKIRQAMIDGSFKYCHVDKCCQNGQLLVDNIKNVSPIAPPPVDVELGMSSVCNCLCIMCRRNEKVMYREFDNAFYDTMRVKYLPIIKHAKMLSLNSYGEVFFDDNCKRLIKWASVINKKLKFQILTNGVFADKEHFEDYGIIDRTYRVSVSIHAATKKTYNSIVKRGNFDRVVKNVEWLAKEKKNHRFKEVIINFVVQQKNYKEMIDFAKWAQKLKIKCCFWEVRLEDDNTELWNKYMYEKDIKIRNKEMARDASEYYKAAVHLPEHPEHKQLVEIVKNPIFQKRYCEINDLLLNLK